MNFLKTQNNSLARKASEFVNHGDAGRVDARIIGRREGTRQFHDTRVILLNDHTVVDCRQSRVTFIHITRGRLSHCHVFDMHAIYRTHRSSNRSFLINNWSGNHFLSFHKTIRGGESLGLQQNWNSDKHWKNTFVSFFHTHILYHAILFALQTYTFAAFYVVALIGKVYCNKNLLHSLILFYSKHTAHAKYRCNANCMTETAFLI